MTTQAIATLPDYAAQLRGLIHAPAVAGLGRGNSFDEARFNQLALALFALQFAQNVSYRLFCEARNATPQSMAHWSAIPAVPTAAFKEWDMTSLPPSQRTSVFHSSGTTGQRPSRHFHNAESLAVYEASLRSWFAANALVDAKGKTDFLFLTPPPAAAPHSSLVHMFATLQREGGPVNSRFAGDGQPDGGWELNFDAALDGLREAIAKNRPLIVMGTAFNFIHLLDHLQAEGARLRLPPHSRVMETGGYKGRSRALPKAELHALITEVLGVPARDIICEYGMSELSSQAYDSAGADTQATGRNFRFPPWARAQIISPETGREAAEGETGLVRIFDLANVYSVMAIQTEDLAVRRGSGFELLGRAALAEPRGCSWQSS